MKHGFVKVAAVTPDIRVADVEFNTVQICKMIDETVENGAKVIVFPELCITGYTCQDLYTHDVLLEAAKDALFEIAAHTLEKDALIFVSDGVIHAGAGMVLNLGWSWPEVAQYLQSLDIAAFPAKKITSALLGVCEDLYIQRPGDDTTVATIKVVKPKVATLFSGPPSDKALDEAVVHQLMSTQGKKIVCGGTAANIVSRTLGTEVTTSFDIIDPRIPPIGHIRGIDLVTEGVLTLQGAVEKLERIKESNDISFLYEKDGASLLARMLFEDCTHIHMIVGRAINPAHQNPDFPQALSIKLNILHHLERVLIELGKIVEFEVI